MPPELSLAQRRPGWFEHVPQAWRASLAQLALAWTGLLLLTWADWAEMGRQWWNSSTCNHVLLIPPILGWLGWLRWPELRKLRPQAWWPPLLCFAAGLAAWSLGTVTGVNLVAELGAVMLL